MTSTVRFDNAIQKLYDAFNNNELQPECCCKCAVGHIMDGRDIWKHFTLAHGSTNLSYVGKVHQGLGRRFAGYSPLELLKIEAAFLRACGYSLPLDYKTKPSLKAISKDHQFKGLCAVIDLLCEFDGIPNVLEYQKVFEKVQLNSLTAVA